MKTILRLTTILIASNYCFSQNLDKETTDLWWNIYGGCFAGTHFKANNSLFMSTANKESSGSIFTLEKNFLGKIIDKGLTFNYKTLKEIDGFPSLWEDNQSATPPCNFVLSHSNSATIDIYGKLVDEANIGRINAELQTIIKKAKAQTLDIEKWGLDQIEEGKLILALQDEVTRSYKTLKLIKNGRQYVSTMGIWIEGVSFKYELDKETVTTIKAIYEAKEKEFLAAGVSFNFQSETDFSTNFNYKDRFYPFLKFKKIEVSGILKDGNGTPFITLENVELKQ